jgi:hypothetical protein
MSLEEQIIQVVQTYAVTLSIIAVVFIGLIIRDLRKGGRR